MPLTTAAEVKPVPKGGGKKQRAAGAARTSVVRAEDPAGREAGGSKKKRVSRSKARRYAEQDEEDRELAMCALGHGRLRDAERSQEKLV